MNNLPPIGVDVTDISSEFSFTREESDGFINDILSAIVDTFTYDWAETVKNSDLNTSKEEYLNAIYVHELNNNTFEVGLLPGSWLPTAVELGVQPFDEKDPGFWNSPKAKVGKDGKKYFTVPFKQAIPSSNASSQTFTGKLPKQVYEVLSKKRQSGDNTPLKLGEIPAQFQVSTVRKQVTTYEGEIRSEYTRKTSIFEGISRSLIPFHSGYISFRRASENNLDAFIHTGITARHLMDVAFEKIKNQEVLSNIVENRLANFVENR